MTFASENAINLGASIYAMRLIFDKALSDADNAGMPQALLESMGDLARCLDATFADAYTSTMLKGHGHFTLSHFSDEARRIHFSNLKGSK